MHERVCLTSISPPEVSRSYTIVGVSIFPHINTSPNWFRLPQPLRRLLSDEERLTSKQPWDSRPCLLWLRAGSPLIEQARGGLYPRCCARLRPGKRRNNKDTEIFIKSMLERRQTSRPRKNKSSEELAAAKTDVFLPVKERLNGGGSLL